MNKKLNKNKALSREGFASSYGAFVALVGSAIGLGNLWRFPYLMGTNGGSIFIIIYLFFVLFLCIPIMIAEFTIGRHSQSNAFSAMEKIAPGSKWGKIGILFVIIAFLILSFYSVVGGWTVDYLFRSLTFNLPANNEAADCFHLATSSTFRPVIFTFVFILLSSIVLLLGVKEGIEKCAKWMMPLLFISIIILVINSITLKGSSAGINFMLKPDFSKVTSHTILSAMGQAFFSLSIGMGLILTYGSYVRKQDNMLKITTRTAIGDTVFALLAGLAIMPAVFALGMSPSEGPGLLFIVLPEIFKQITGGAIFAILFFLAVFLAAITSAFSILEVIVAYLSQEFDMGRKKAIILSSSFCGFFALLCSLSLGPLNNFKIFGYELFSLFDAATANFLMPIGALLIVLFVAWRMPKKAFFDEISSSGLLKNKTLYQLIYFIIKYIAPLAIIIIMIFGLIN